MTVSQRGTPVIATGTTSVTGTWPTGSTQTKGDLLVAVVGGYGSTSNVAAATPAGWTLLESNDDFPPPVWTGIYTRVAAGGDAAPAFSITATGSTNMACVLYDLADTSGLTPQVTVSGSNFGTSGTIAATTGGNVPSSGCFAISGAICGDGTTSATTTWTTPSNWSLGGDQTTANVSQLASYYYSSPPSGSTLSCLFTHSRTSTIQVAALIVAQPPVPGALSVIATMGGSTYEGMALNVVALTGAAANPAGTTGTAAGTTGHVSITPAASGSWIYGAVNDSNADTTLTAESGTTFSVTIQDAYNTAAYGTFRSTSTTTASTPVTTGTTSALTGGGVAAAEIKAAGTLAEYESQNNEVETATSCQTYWFTPPPGSLLVAQLAAGGSAGTATAAVTDTRGLTWTQVASAAGTGDGYSGVWLAQVPATPAWQPQPARARLPQPQPRAGRTGSSPGAPEPVTYYVSPAGSDSSNGLSPATPWQTIAKVNGTTLIPGDTVLFQGGQTFSGTMLQPGQGGTAALPVTFGSYGTGQATITNSSDSAIYVYESGGVTVENLIITGPGATPAGAGGYVGVFFNRDRAGYAPPVAVTGCTITGWADGILAGASLAGGGYNGITFTNNSISVNRDAGINVYGTGYSHQNVIITGNAVFSQTGYSGNTTTSSGHGIVVGNASGGTIAQNVTYGNGASCGCTTAGPVGNWAYSSQNLVIENNVSYQNKTASPGNADGDGFDLDDQCVGCTLQYNIAYENDGFGIACYSDDDTWSGNVIRYNVTWGNSVTNPDAAEIAFTGGAFASCEVYGNTFVGQVNAELPSVVLLYGASFTSVSFWNNIFYTAASGVAIIYSDANYTGVTFQGNLYYSAAPFVINWNSSDYSTLAAWRTGTGQEILSGHNTGIQANPQFSAPAATPAVTSPSNLAPAYGLHLTPGSPGIAQGLNLSLDFSVTPGTQDFFGNAIGNPLWIGAYQGTPVTWLSSPVRFHPKLPPRGRVAGISFGAPVQNPALGPVFHKAVRPARAVIPRNAPRGRTYSSPGAPVRNPGTGPKLPPVRQAVRARYLNPVYVLGDPGLIYVNSWDGRTP